MEVDLPGVANDFLLALIGSACMYPLIPHQINLRTRGSMQVVEIQSVVTSRFFSSAYLCPCACVGSPPLDHVHSSSVDQEILPPSRAFPIARFLLLLLESASNIPGRRRTFEATATDSTGFFSTDRQSPGPEQHHRPASPQGSQSSLEDFLQTRSTNNIVAAADARNTQLQRRRYLHSLPPCLDSCR